MDAPRLLSASGTNYRGGWITFPFIIGAMAGLSVAAGGWVANLIVYLIEEFNVRSIKAAQIYNMVNGVITLFPIVGAIVADSFLSCFSVVFVSSLVSLLGMILLALTATIKPLRPHPCKKGHSLCTTTPSRLQKGVLYAGLALASIGVGGGRFTMATMGADQFDKPKHQAIFFDWFVLTLYTSVVVSSTALVYVEDNVSWALGFGLSVALCLLGLAIFLLGSRFYRHAKPRGSPFTSLARVVVAALRKRKVFLSAVSQDYCQEPQSAATKTIVPKPSNTFKFLNRAALKTEGDVGSDDDGSIGKPWRLCTVQQVEDLKKLIKIFPLWTTGLFLCTPLDIQSSMLILQALTMDRQLGPHFKIPPGSMIVVLLISTSITLTILDWLLYPSWHKLTGRPLTPLRRVGVGHTLTVISMVVSALVESKRLKVAESHNLTDDNGSDVAVPMSVFWLVPQLVIAGVGEAFHFPGQVAFYYQEFPASMKTTSTAMVAIFVGIAYYLSNGVMDLIRRTTAWLPDDINHGRLDNAYWVCAVIAGLNFVYYLSCAYLYKHQNVDGVDDDITNPSHQGM